MANPTERYLVTMTSAFALPNGETAIHQATDHVAQADLEVYIADAQTRWQAVVVADEPDEITGPYDVEAATTAPQEG